jgi:putative transposase
MAKRQFNLSEDEIRTFRQHERQTRDTNELRRLQAVRLYGTGMAVATILTIVDTSESSIRQWAQHFRETGFEALRSKWQGNNAKKLNDNQRANLRERLHQGHPEDWQIGVGQFWTVSDLAVAVQHWYGVTYQSQRSYVSLMHECGFSYQHAEKVYRSRASEREIADFEAELEKK